MKFIQYSIVLPISLEDAPMAERFINLMIESDILKNEEENINNILIEEYSDNEYLNGTKILKKYCLGSSLPLFFHELCKNQLLELEEEKIMFKYKSKSTFKCQSFKNMFLEVYSHYIEGDNPISSPFKVTGGMFNIEKIDAITEELEFFTNYTQEIKHSLYENFNINADANWRKNQKNLITVYKLIQIDLNFGEYQNEMENYLLFEIKKYLIYFYKSMLLMVKQWKNIREESIFRMENEMKAKNSNNKIIMYKTFKEEINDLNDLIRKTNFLDLRKNYLENKLLFHDENITTFRNQFEKPKSNKPLTSKSLTNLALENNSNTNIPVQRNNTYLPFENNEKSPMNDIKDLTKKALLKRKTGFLYKRGDGPIDFNWNHRYLVLDGKMLFYYKYASDKTPRGIIKLEDFQISELKRIDDREFAFTIDFPYLQKIYYFSGDNKLETEGWMKEIAEAGGLKMKSSIELKDDHLVEKASPDEIINKETSENDEKKNKNNQILRSRVNILSEDMYLKDFPMEIYYLKNIFNSFQNENTSWKFFKFKNGVKIFKNFQENVSKSALKKYFALNIIFSLFFAYFLQEATFFMFIFLILNFPISFFVLIQILFIFGNNKEFIAKISIDEDAVSVFKKLKKIKFRSKWDINLETLHKSTSLEDSKTKKHYTYCFDHEFHPSIFGFMKKNSKNERNIIRYSFILNDETYFIIEVSNSQKNKHADFIEMIILEKYASISGKCSLMLYSKIERSFNFMRNKTSKFHSNRLTNLALIRELFGEEKLKEMTLDWEEDRSAASEQDIRSPKNNKEHNAIVSHIKSYRKYPDINENDQKPQDNNNHNNQLNNSKLKFNPNKYSAWFTIVDKMSNGMDDSIQRKSIEERKPGYRKVKDGGLECFNNEELKCQEGIVFDLMKSAGKTLMEGKNVVGISLPVRIFEPRSTIERVCDWFAFAPIYLSRAALIKNNPLERMKNVVTFAISGLYNGCKQLKPFNPILGETFQAYWPDGTEIYLEHTSHHPPVSNFLVNDYAGRYTYYGYYEYKASIKGNSLAGRQEGPNIIHFHDDGQRISYVLPQINISGMIFGTRIIEWYGNIQFKDEKNDLVCKIQFYEGGGFFQKRLHPSDYFEGVICRLSNNNDILCKVHGSWLENVCFDGKVYWDLEKIEPAVIMKSLDPLPSDCRYREDLIFLSKKDMEKAQEHKIRLEVIQRADRKLRLDKLKKSHKK